MAEGAPVAHPRIIILQPLPFVQLATHHTQQVVAERLAALARDDERLIAIRPHLRQHLRMGHCTLAIVLAAGFRIVGYLAVAVINLAQHRSIDGS